MAKEVPLKIVDLGNLFEICNGDRAKEIRYLKQFNTLVLQRINLLRRATIENNLDDIRREVHKMSPQAEFFGILQVVKLKRILEIEPVIFNDRELKKMISDIVTILEKATGEIDLLLKNEIGKEIG